MIYLATLSTTDPAVNQLLVVLTVFALVVGILVGFFLGHKIMGRPAKKTVRKSRK